MQTAAETAKTAPAQQIVLKIGRRSYPVADYAEASRMYCAARDRAGTGASRTPMPAANAIKPLIPSSWLLQKQVDAAMAKFDAAREQALLRKEARRDAYNARARDAEVKARFYRRIVED